MAATFTSLRAKIKSVLDTVTELAFVFDEHVDDIDGYPAATFDNASNAGVFLTNVENQREIAYDIVIYQSIQDIGKSEATRILDATTDAVIKKFEENFSLDGEVNWCDAFGGNRGQFDNQSGTVYFQTLTLICRFSVLVGNA